MVKSRLASGTLIPNRKRIKARGAMGKIIIMVQEVVGDNVAIRQVATGWMVFPIDGRAFPVRAFDNLDYARLYAEGWSK